MLCTKEGKKTKMLIYPKAYLENVTKIEEKFLRENGIKGIILDVDNTLIDYDKKLLKRCKGMV